MINIEKPKVVIAGAGGGKTHQMIEEIIKIIPILRENPEKFCAVVTYTNSATEEIKQRISKKIGIPNNLHISTTHSFLIKFIIDPYGHLSEKIPIEKSYIDKVKLTYRPKNPFAEKNTCCIIANDLCINKGIITYDKILEISYTLITNPIVCRSVCNRLAYVFVDEYQDIRLYQHNVFKSIILEGKTNFYCIGDPLQSIFRFAYIQSQLSKKEPKPKNFNESPILDFAKNKNFLIEKIEINNRCSSNIINLINKYNQIVDFKQTLPTRKVCNKIPVYFIKGNTKSEILGKYDELIVLHNIVQENNKMFNLLIAQEWDIFNDIKDITTINNDQSGQSRSMFAECSRIVLGALGLNRSTAIDLIGVSDNNRGYLLYRHFCFGILKKIRLSKYKVDAGYIINCFEAKFHIKLPGKVHKNTNIEDGIKKLSVIDKQSDNNRFCSSIHAAKGLEATNVLVIAKTKNELSKWLDFNNVIHNTDDDYRLGYVAFSRAREMLCITCLEKLTVEQINLMAALQIQIK